MISAMVAASEWEESTRLTEVVEMGGREEEVVGRMVRVGVGLVFRDEECKCSL